MNSAADPEVGSSLTVAEALELPTLKRGVPEVVAGARSLDRPVRWVHSSEWAGIASLLEGAEMLLTSGLNLELQPARQRRFIDDLADREVAALVLELGPKFEQPPGPLVAAAEDRGLPFVVLHQAVPFVSVTQEVHSQIINRQFSLLRRGDELHNRFSELLLNGAGAAEIVVALSEIVGNPAILEKRDRGVMYAATAATEEGQVFAAWQAFGRSPDATAALAQDVRTGDSEPWGRLIVFALERPLTAQAEVAVDRAARLIALTLVQFHQEDLLVARGRGDMLRSLIEGRLDDLQAENAARALGFDPPRGGDMLPIAVGNVHDEPEAPMAARRRWADVSAKVTTELNRNGTGALAGISDDDGAMLLVIELEGDREVVARAVAETIRRTASRGSTGQVAVSVAESARTWEQVRRGLSTAVRGLPSAAADPGLTWFDAAKPSVSQLLLAVGRLSEADEFVEARLGRLIAHDKAKNPKLLRTLETYFASGMSKTETARSLHLERQSLYHRLARIEELLGESLDDEETLFGLQLALRLHAGGEI